MASKSAGSIPDPLTETLEHRRARRAKHVAGLRSAQAVVDSYSHEAKVALLGTILAVWVREAGRGDPKSALGRAFEEIAEIRREERWRLGRIAAGFPNPGDLERSADKAAEAEDEIRNHRVDRLESFLRRHRRQPALAPEHVVSLRPDIIAAAFFVPKDEVPKEPASFFQKLSLKVAAAQDIPLPGNFSRAVTAKYVERLGEAAVAIDAGHQAAALAYPRVTILEPDFRPLAFLMRDIARAYSRSVRDPDDSARQVNGLKAYAHYVSKALAGEPRRTQRGEKSRSAAPTPREMEALRAYRQTGTYAAVGEQLGISGQAAAKLVRSANRRIEAAAQTSRGPRTRRLPTDRRGQVTLDSADEPDESEELGEFDS